MPATRLVTWASKTVQKARPKPASTAPRAALAGAQLLSDAFVDDDVGVDGHTDGEHDAGDAGQRQRGAERGQDRQLVDDVEHHRDVGDEARQRGSR